MPNEVSIIERINILSNSHFWEISRRKKLISVLCFLFPFWELFVGAIRINILVQILRKSSFLYFTIPFAGSETTTVSPLTLVITT